MIDKSKNPVILSVLRHRQNRLESTQTFFRKSAYSRNRDSSIGIEMGYGLGFQSSIPGILTGSGVHPATYAMSIIGDFPQGKAAGVSDIKGRP
jgi:hypothetical protein